MRTAAYLSLSLLLVGLGTSAQNMASNAPPRQPRLITDYRIPGLDKKVSLDSMEAIDVVDFLKFLCQKCDLNVVIGREVAGNNKFMLKDATVGEALEIVLAANNLAYEIQGNIIKVMTDKAYQELHGESFYERKQAKVIELKYATPSRVATMLADVKSAIGKIVYDDGTGNIVLIDTPQKIQEMEAIIQKTEIPSVQRVLPTVTTNFVLQYAKIEDVEPKLVPLLTKDVGQVQSDKETKTLIVTELPASMQKISDMVALFDRPRKQVFIEAKIVQVTLSDTLSFGVNWDHLFQGMDPRFSLRTVSKSAGLGPLDINSAADAVLGGGITYHTIAAGGDLNAVVRALATVGKTRLLQNPHIATLDGEKATIKAITTEPYAETTFESGTTNITGKTYKFVDVGVTLDVTPRINELGFITCEIRPEVSTVLRWYDADAGTTGNSGVPVVQKSYAQTRISVQDGVTIIIAGMIDEKEEHNRNQVPLLGSIPLLGALFRYDDKSTVKTETIVLLTPRIVTGTKFFERSKDMKRPTKADGGDDTGLLRPDMTP